MTPLEATTFFESGYLQWNTIGDDTQYYAYQDGDETVIIFAPSNSKIDWKNNFKFWKKPYKRMDVTFYVHSGFLRCWKLINDFFIDLVKDTGCKKLTIIGHSYGGAIALLCAEDMWYNIPELRGHINTITFGAPRILGWFNYKKIKERWEGTREFSNGTDMVTMIPPSFFGYRHPRKVIHIGKLRNFIDFFKPQKFHDIYSEGGYHDTLNEITL